MSADVGDRAVIELERVSVVREGKRILDDVTWRVERGECWAIMGANGAGKSTLLSVLSGYTWPTSGVIRVLGGTYGRVDLGEVRERTGLMEPSRMPEFDGRMSCREVIATGLYGTVMLPFWREIGEAEWERVEREVMAIGLGAIAGEGFGKLSTGEKAKVLIGRAVVGEPELFILDEPTAGLDMRNRAEIVAMLDGIMTRERRPTMIVVSHHFDELPGTLDKVLLLKRGGVLRQGRAEEVVTSENISEAFGCSAEVFRRNGRFAASVRVSSG